MFKKFLACNDKSRGFTLTEILIAISIVVLVFGVGISSASAVRKRSRDAQRMADLRMIQSALQHFYTDRNHYPNGVSGSPPTISGILNDCLNEPSCTTSKVYLSVIPSDPLGGAYVYRAAQDNSSSYGTNCIISSSAGTCHYYVLCADLEGNSTQTTENDQCEAINANYNFQVNP